MSDHEEGVAAPAGASAKKEKSSGVGKTIPVLLVMNLLVTGAGVALPIIRPAAAHPPAATAEAGHDKPAEHAPEKVGPSVQIPSIIVNLNEAGSGRYLKVTVELQVGDKVAVAFIDDNKSIVRDTLLRSLSNLTIADTQGEEAKAKIGQDLATRLNKEIGGERIKRVLFTEFVVQ